MCARADCIAALARILYGRPVIGQGQRHVITQEGGVVCSGRNVKGKENLT